MLLAGGWGSVGARAALPWSGGSGSVGAQRHDSVEHGSGHGPLVGQGDILVHAVGPDEHDGIGVVLEADARGTDVVGHDEVEVLALELLAGVEDEVVGL